MANQSPDFKAALAQITKVHTLLRQELSAKETKRAKQPYKNSASAAEIRECIETVLGTGVPMIWPAVKVSVQTLYLKFQQGRQALLAEDPDFAAKAELITATKVGQTGLRIAPKEVRSGLRLYFHDTAWKSALEEFIDAAQPGEKFERVAIPMSAQDLEWIRATIAPVSKLFISHISEEKILLIRYDKPN